MASLDFDPAFPVRLTSGASDNHPTAAETGRGLIACVWERSGEMWRSYSLDRGLTWAAPQKFANQTPIYTPRARYNNRDGFALVWGNPATERDIWFEEINEVMGISDHVVDMHITRSQDSTSKSATITLINPNKLYDPEVPNSKWSGVFYPGSKIKINLGFGGENKTRFLGYIDRVNVYDSYNVMNIECRGQFKQLLDQHLKVNTYYTNKKCSAIVAELAIKAGIPAEQVVVQDSDILWTGKWNRQTSYQEAIDEMIEMLGYILFEPDEGGLVARYPSATTTAQWFYEEELNMFSRAREWDDDDVFNSVVVFRDPVLNKDGSVKTPGLEVEELVPTEFLVPGGKTDFIKIDSPVFTEAQARSIARNRALQIAREGSLIEIATPLNVALELTDVINIRRKSIAQSGVYAIDALDDDCRRNAVQARDLTGEFAVGNVPGFANIVQARRVL